MNAIAATLPEKDLWAAVLGRNREYDGKIVYAVRSTSIFCRPSCPSRKPRRENVEFFRTAAEAERKGYRACRRCRPGSPAGTATDRALRRAMEYLESHLDEPVTLERLGRQVGMSPFHLQRTFRARVGVSPRVYQHARRLERFKARLQQGESVSRATYEAGFGSSRSVYQQAAAGLGMSPGAYRRGARGMAIRFTTADSPHGRLLVAGTERGVCAVSLGNTDDALEADLRREFPGARLERDDAEMVPWVSAILGELQGQSPNPDVPLDLQGTAFQMRVWNALREIPRGETRSYSQVAAAIGQPSAARAVAGACAGNRAALVVPCHRVVRTDGVPGGYRWGPDLKQALLQRERGG